MTVTAEDFLQFAKNLARDGATEIEFRNSVSRLYYAAYHLCLREIVSHDRAFTPAFGHAAFCAQLSAYPPGSSHRQLGVVLNYLRQQRNAADYTLERDFSRADVTTAEGAYGNLLGRLSTVVGGLATPPPRNTA